MTAPTMPTATSRGIPRPTGTDCDQCGEPVIYKGFGQKPKRCSTACSNAARAANRAASKQDRRAAAKERPSACKDARQRIVFWFRMGRNLPAADTRPAWEAGHVAEHLQGVADSWIPKAAVEEVYSGDAGWMRAATPRRRDPAAMWLAEHHPDALDGFGPAV